MDIKSRLAEVVRRLPYDQPHIFVAQFRIGGEDQRRQTGHMRTSHARPIGAVTDGAIIEWRHEVLARLIAGGGHDGVQVRARGPYRQDVHSRRRHVDAFTEV